MEAVTDRPPSLLSRLVKAGLLALYRWKGWAVEGAAPGTAKCIILGAPHTSNWDFVFFLGATWQLGIEPAFMGKHTLFKWPMTRFMFDMGGFPVNRTIKANYVDQVVAEFARRESLALVIAPEGTRSSKGAWRSGFYHIAMGAGVPLVPAWVDNRTMTGGVGEPIVPSGDYRADMAKLLAFYRAKVPGHPRWDVLEQSLADEGEPHHG